MQRSKVSASAHRAATTIALDAREVVDGPRRRKPGFAAQQLAHRAALPLPHLERDERGALGRRGHQPRG